MRFDYCDSFPVLVTTIKIGAIERFDDSIMVLREADSSSFILVDKAIAKELFVGGFVKIVFVPEKDALLVSPVREILFLKTEEGAKSRILIGKNTLWEQLYAF